VESAKIVHAAIQGGAKLVGGVMVLTTQETFAAESDSTNQLCGASSLVGAEQGGT
jgi:hypothetical protein